MVDDLVTPDSEKLLAGFGSGKIRVDWETTTASGGNSMYGIPSMSCPAISRCSPSLSAPTAKKAMQARYRSFRACRSRGGAGTNGGPPSTAKVKDGGDHHAIVLRRDETTGGIDRLYEYYQVASDDGGSTWKNLGSGAQFDLKTGAPRPEFWTSSDAAGLPILPLLVRYDEAARGEIKHPFRVCISPGLSRNRLVWPARHAVYSGSATTGLPMGRGCA